MAWSHSKERFEQVSATNEALQGLPGSILVPVTTFAPEPFELVKDILVVVQSTGEDFTASFFDANIHASGDTQEEAVANLKDVMLIMLRRFEKEPEHRLGPEPKRQLAVLRDFIREPS